VVTADKSLFFETKSVLVFAAATLLLSFSIDTAFVEAGPWNWKLFTTVLSFLWKSSGESEHTGAFVRFNFGSFRPAELVGLFLLRRALESFGPAVFFEHSQQVIIVEVVADPSFRNQALLVVQVFLNVCKFCVTNALRCSSRDMSLSISPKLMSAFDIGSDF
jgi:hypothetical protein